MSTESPLTPTARWQAKATSAWQAWQQVTGSAPPNPQALRLFLAQAQFETQCGDAWRDARGVASCNWGACDLRAMNATEKEAFASGALVIGEFISASGAWGVLHNPGAVGTLRGDSDPNTGGFRVFFACFDTDTQGAAYMLRAGVRTARAALLDPLCDPFTYAKALYVGCCYFGGTHAGARPCGRRPDPLNAAETANVQAYADALGRQLPAIDLGLATWQPPGEYSQAPERTIAGDNVSPNTGDEVVNANGPTEPAPAPVTEEDDVMGTASLAAQPVAVHFNYGSLRRNPDPHEPA